MSIKKFSTLLTIFTACLCQMAVAGTTAPAQKPAQYNDHPAYNFHGEIDKTDIYAIPLDNSEEEQNEELSEFETESKEYLESKESKK